MMLEKRLTGFQTPACDPTKAHCFTTDDVPSQSVPFTSIAVGKVVRPQPATLPQVRFPTDPDTDKDIISAEDYAADCVPKNGRTVCSNSKKHFATMLSWLKSNYPNGGVEVLIEDATYKFELPASRKELTGSDPSIALTGLRDIRITGIGNPILEFANTRSSGIEIFDCQRLEIRNLTLDYDYSADFSEALACEDRTCTPIDEGFNVAPYVSSFYDAKIVDDRGGFQVLRPSGIPNPNNPSQTIDLSRIDLSRDFRNANIFNFNITAPFHIPTPGQPTYFLPPPRGVSGYHAERPVFDPTPVVKEGDLYRHSKLASEKPGALITVAKQRTGYLHAIALRDAARDWGQRGAPWQFRQNTDILLHDITLHQYPQVGIYAHGGSRLRLSEIKILPKTNHNHSGRADGIHLAGTTDVEIEHSTLRGQGDDAVNIRGMSSTVFGIAQSLMCQGGNQQQELQRIEVDFRKPNTSLRGGYEDPEFDSMYFRPGDAVVLLAKTFTPLVNGIVESITTDEVQRTTHARIVLGNACDDACVEDVLEGARLGSGGGQEAVLFNLTRSGARYYVHDNKFQFSASRGILVQAPHGVVEDNIMTGLSDSAIRVQAKNDSAGIEGPGVANVVVRRNQIHTVGFEQSAYGLYNGAISVGTLDADVASTTNGAALVPIIQRVILQDNEIANVGQAAVTVSQARQVELSWSSGNKGIAGCFRAAKSSRDEKGWELDKGTPPAIRVRKSVSVTTTINPNQIRLCK